MNLWISRLAVLACLLLPGVFRLSFAFTTSSASAACLKQPVGIIGRVYRLNEEDPVSQTLGLPVSLEKDFSSGLEIPCGAEQNKFQEFQYGRIYYDAAEKIAFIIHSDLGDYYHIARNKFGLPISSQIGSLAQANCRGYFKLGYALCTDQVGADPIETGFWDNLSLAEITAKMYLPVLKLPFEHTFSGLMISGPHAWNAGNGYNTTYSAGLGSGLDFGGSSGSMNVLSMADGTVVEIYPDPLKYPALNCQKERSADNGIGGMGCWVVVRNQFSGTVLIYGHMQPNPALRVGDWIEQGRLLGVTTSGKIGSSSGPHLHVEFRTGIARCWASCPGGEFLRSYGEPLDWHGVIVDGYLISGGVLKPGLGLNYDGTAVKVNPGEYNLHHKYSQSELEKMWGSESDFVYKTFSFVDKGDISEKRIKSWLTRKASAACDRLFNGRCDTSPAYNGTVFVWGSLKSSNRAPLTGGVYP